MQTAIGFLIVPAAPSLCNNCLTSVGLQKEEREGGRAKAKREEEKVVSRNEEHRGARSGLCYSTEEDDDLLASENKRDRKSSFSLPRCVSSLEFL